MAPIFLRSNITNNLPGPFVPCLRHCHLPLFPCWSHVGFCVGICTFWSLPLFLSRCPLPSCFFMMQPKINKHREKLSYQHPSSCPPLGIHLTQPNEHKHHGRTLKKNKHKNTVKNFSLLFLIGFYVYCFERL